MFVDGYPRKGKDNTVICYAYGVVYGNEDVASLPTYTKIQTQLDSNTKLIADASVDSVSSTTNNPCNISTSPIVSTTSTPALLSTLKSATTPNNRLSTRGPQTTSSAFNVTRLATTKPTTHSSSPGLISSTSVPTVTSTQGLPSTASPTKVSTTVDTFTTHSQSPASVTGPTTRMPISTSKVSSVATTFVTPLTRFTSTAQTSTSSTSRSASPVPSAPTTAVISSTATVTTLTSGKPPTTVAASTSSSTTPSGVTSTSQMSSGPTKAPPISTAATMSTSQGTTGNPNQSSSVSTTAGPSTPTTMSATSPTSVQMTSATANTESSMKTTPGNTVTSASPSIGTMSSSQVPPSTAKTSISTTSSHSTTATIPSTSSLSTTAATTTTSCTGEYKYSGDIAVAFELTTGSMTNEVEAFVTTLLTYTNNPYSFEQDAITELPPSSYILAPYPNTNFYGSPNKYSVLRASDLDALLNTFNKILANNPVTEANMNDAFDFISQAKNQGKVRAIVLAGVSDAFVQEAQQKAQALIEQGYQVFTVSIGGSSNFNTLSSDASHSFNISTPYNLSEATGVASDIGEMLLSESSICYHDSAAVTTTMQPKTTTSTSTSVPVTTSPSCGQPIINQDIAFVVEISTSSGNLDASQIPKITTLVKAASNFITQYLISEAVFDDLHSNYAIVPFPDASTYSALSGGIEDFGKLRTSDFSATFQMMFKLFPITNGNTSDIDSGLSYTEDHEFPLLHDVYPRTILLFANSAEGVQSAMGRATELKSNNVTILTISVSDDADSINLRPLSSSSELQKVSNLRWEGPPN
ncbi:hypothetical protein ANCDUO_06232 [Ancylostoma duodenale]|uniref:VWFA domain-containing protein n=1 Tax=Ancylostoma duodenale TaxID=51022 RepID=A0A0C2H244_9BILA|nr:hypothetical protein ANCDUO_06232 [Ancylostoma duodenale]